MCEGHLGLVGSTLLEKRKGRILKGTIRCTLQRKSTICDGTVQQTENNECVDYVLYWRNNY